MENIIFGTYNVSNDGLTITYNAPSVLPKEMMDKISFNTDRLSAQEKIVEETFGKTLKAITKVPKPTK